MPRDEFNGTDYDNQDSQWLRSEITSVRYAPLDVFADGGVLFNFRGATYYFAEDNDTPMISTHDTVADRSLALHKLLSRKAVEVHS